MASRDTLLTAIGSGLSFLRARAGALDISSLDFDLARRLQIEEITGVQEDGVPSRIYGRLSEGTEDSIERLRELRGVLRAQLEAIRENPDQYGVKLSTSTVESVDV